MLILAFQSIVDGLILGRLIGTNALATVNIVTPTYAPNVSNDCDYWCWDTGSNVYFYGSQIVCRRYECVEKWLDNEVYELACSILCRERRACLNDFTDRSIESFYRVSRIDQNSDLGNI